MTSSPADGDKPEKVPGWRQPWERWRILMMSGSLVLLGLAFSQVGGDLRLPEWARIVGFGIGYGLLGYGFILAMRTRRELQAKRQAELKRAKKRVSPRDQGRSTG